MTEVSKRRASGVPGVRFTATQVASDEVGTWLLVEPSTPCVHDEGWVVFLSPNPVLLLLPEGGPWVASTSHTGAKVDLCKGVAVEADRVEFVDIELDVVWRWGDPARVEDVEEFVALELPAVEAQRYLVESERIRACVDAGEPPFGASFRQRLVDLSRPADPRLQSTWAGAVAPFLVDPVSRLVGPKWIAEQRAGSGWLLCGGRQDVDAVVWVERDGRATLLTATATAEAEAMGSYLLNVAPGLASFPGPPTPA